MKNFKQYLSESKNDLDPFNEENWEEQNLQPLPARARCLYGYDDFVEGEIYEVDGGYGDPERAIEDGYFDYMPLKYMKKICLKVGNKKVTIDVAEFIMFFDNVD